MVAWLTIFVAWITRTSESSGAWLLGLMLAALLFRAVVPTFFPLETTVFRDSGHISFMVCYFAVAVTVFILDFVLLGWATFIMGTKAELTEHFQMLSFPLAWFNPNYMITANRTFLDALGIVLANSYFGAFAYWICGNTVGYIFKRNRVIQLGVGHDPQSED